MSYCHFYLRDTYRGTVPLSLSFCFFHMRHSQQRKFPKLEKSLSNSASSQKKNIGLRHFFAADPGRKRGRELFSPAGGVLFGFPVWTGAPGGGGGTARQSLAGTQRERVSFPHWMALVTTGNQQ